MVRTVTLAPTANRNRAHKRRPLSSEPVRGAGGSLQPPALGHILGPFASTPTRWWHAVAAQRDVL
jgi:hypothetical protein